MSPVALGLVIGGTWMILGTLVALAFGLLARVGMYDTPPDVGRGATDWIEPADVHATMAVKPVRVLDLTPRDLSGIDDDKVIIRLDPRPPTVTHPQRVRGESS